MEKDGASVLNYRIPLEWLKKIAETAYIVEDWQFESYGGNILRAKRRTVERQDGTKVEVIDFQVNPGD